MDPNSAGNRGLPNWRFRDSHLRVMNREELSRAYAKNTVYGEETPAIVDIVERIERQVFELATNEPLGGPFTVSSSYPPQQQPLAAVASSSYPPQQQPSAGRLTVASSSGPPQQQTLAGPPTVGNIPQQQPQEEQPGFETEHISEHDLNRFEDLARWSRENGFQ